MDVQDRRKDVGRVERCSSVTIGFGRHCTARSQTHRRSLGDSATDCHGLTDDHFATRRSHGCGHRRRILAGVAGVDRRRSPASPAPAGAAPSAAPRSAATTTRRRSSSAADGGPRRPRQFSATGTPGAFVAYLGSPRRHRRRGRRRDAASTRPPCERAWARADTQHQEAVLAALTQLGVPYRRRHVGARRRLRLLRASPPTPGAAPASSCPTRAARRSAPPPAATTSTRRRRRPRAVPGSRDDVPRRRRRHRPRLEPGRPTSS